MTQVTPRTGWPLAPLTLAVGAIPFIVVHIAWLMSLRSGYIDACNPYLAGCTSISAAARHGAPNVLFKAVMLPYTTLLLAYWLAAAHWLSLVGGRSRMVAWIVPLAVAASAFLALYAVFLGSDGHFYQLMRRYGVMVYFAGSFFAQLLFALRLSTLARAGRFPSRWIPRTKLALSLVVLALGLTNYTGALLLDDKNALENAIEWQAALLMSAWYLVTWAAWRGDGYRVDAGRG
ncbi:MAG: hypothetical protein LC632_02250 [Xanthomonadaceae bacterium]|nr:hypothetical protein [Xanthomonadaceae bacterium]